MSGQFANPQTALPEIQAVADAAQEAVSTQFESSRSAAENASSLAQGLLGRIGIIDPITYTAFVPNFNFPNVPTIDTPSIYSGLPPYHGAGMPILEPLESFPMITGNPPEFDVANVVPDIPSFPDLVFPTLTEPRPEIHEPTLPTPPTITLPDLPVFNTVTIPTAMIVDLPVWDALLPPDNITIPTNLIDKGILDYDSPILQMLKSKVLAWVTTSGTGLDPIVEQEMYDRDSERARLLLADTIQNSIDEWSKRKFVLPTGDLFNQIRQHEVEFSNKRLDTSRDIMIKQAELAQTNTHFYIKQAFDLETQLMSWMNIVSQRTFESSKASMDASIAITGQEIAKYNIKLEVYKVQGQVYETRIRAELAKVEIFKAQVEAAKLTADMNKVMADVYVSQIQACEALIKIYEAQIRAAMATLEVDKVKIECFQAIVQSYIAEVNAVTAKFGAYNTRVEGEKTRVQMYGAQVEAYKSRVEAYKAEADVVIEEAKVIVERNKIIIMKFAAEIDLEKGDAASSAEYAKAAADMAGAQAAAARARSEAQSAAAQAALKSAEIQIELSIRAAEAQRDTQKINMEAFRASEATRVEAAKGAAQVAASLASGAFSSLNVSAALQSHASATQSYTGDERLSEDHTFEEKKQ